VTWAKLDDGLYTNRKWRRLAKRSPEAACLWVAAICYSARYLTDGHVPKVDLEDLVPFRQPEKLAAICVEEGAFEDADEAWQVHDYLEFNPSAGEVRTKQAADRERQARRRKAGSAGVDRAGNGRFVTPDDHRDDMRDNHRDDPPDDMRDNHRDDMRESRRVSPATRPVPSRTSSSSTSDSRPPPMVAADDDDDPEVDRSPTDVAGDATVEAVVNERYRRRVSEKGQVGDPLAWKAEARRRVIAEVAEGGSAVLAEALATPSASAKSDPLEGAAAAQRRLAERNDARLRGESACEKCSDSGVFETEDGTVMRCDCPAISATERAG
jgi:hypothetical protein